jgi:hypothetical protein
MTRQLLAESAFAAKAAADDSDGGGEGEGDAGETGQLHGKVSDYCVAMAMISGSLKRTIVPRRS